ncbi:MAG: ferrochelatase [gamma proteobacterium symbiont of Bathyaustriella thionipta]|nr:ferrochelatase [gamma proteobacterium symbiont of Bathyaustriella thionipta]
MTEPMNSETIGVLLVNLGTPEAATTSAVRRYLAEFLSDPRVMEMNPWLWKPILHAVILPTRPKKSAAAYKKVWTEQGSPLMVISKRQQQALQKRLNSEQAGRFHVTLGMRYGQPSIHKAVDELNTCCGKILVLPLYPQYSATTTASIFDQISLVLRQQRAIPEMRFINQYATHAGYITALANSIRETWPQKKPQKLLLSFHGIPQDYADAGDPYPQQCQATRQALQAELGVSDEFMQMSFQSRLGPRAWLKPYTDETLKQWGQQGVKHVQVISPGFSADCLETLEEVNEENRDYFLQAGGQSFAYIPALNERADHIDMMCQLVQQHTQGW